MYPKRMRLGPPMGYRFPPPPPPEPELVKCGDLWEGYEGHYIRLRGRVVKARLGRFLELRDSRGIAQLVADDEKPKILRLFQTIPIDSYITVYGIVKPRLKPNNTIPTGRVEVHVEEIRDVDFPKPLNPMDGSGPGISGQTSQNPLYRSFSTTTNTPPPKNRSLTSVEFKKCLGSQGIMDRLNNRQTTCGELRWQDVGKCVTLVGWIEKKTHGKFLHLRDGYGSTQIVVDHENDQVKNLVSSITADDFIHVIGYVVARPASNKNMAYETGDIEVLVEHFTILEPSAPFEGPFLNQTEAGAEAEAEEATPKAPLPPPKWNKFTTRTHTCGEINESDIGKEVTLCGWMEFERMRKFFTIRDGYGCTQVMLPDDMGEKLRIENVPFESILEVTGIVMARPPGMRNESMATGDVEVILKDLKVVNPAKRNLPFNLRDHQRPKEALRMEFRYLDLRFSDMQKNLRTRSKVLMKMREQLINTLGFVEVETPTLFRRTPGGAQEFVVPTRKPGHFYSLVQSPQQFKQMLMVGSIDRYFQIARCYRDEATRPDRQPEFTQLDIELSFTDREKIMELVESVLVHCWPDFCGPLTTPFPKLTYQEAMEQYGTDKPDTRFEMKLKNITYGFSLNQEIREGFDLKDGEEFGAYALVIQSPNSTFPNHLKEALHRAAKQEPGAKFYSVKISQTPEDTQGLQKILGSAITSQIVGELNLEKDDLLLFAFGEKEAAQLVMGRTRVSMRENMETRGIYTPSTAFNPLWIIDFPLFCRSERGPGCLDSVHHPFTAVHPDDRADLDSRTNLFGIRSLAYDLVLNGQEIGGGSIRIHNFEFQKRMLTDYLKLNLADFTHMIEALHSGCPPHGGIALGLDRLLAIMCNTDSIRDVIAFPKGLEGKDHLSKAPVQISEEEKNLYSIDIRTTKSTATGLPQGSSVSMEVAKSAKMEVESADTTSDQDGDDGGDVKTEAKA